MLGLYVLLERILHHLSKIPTANYFDTFFYLGFIERLFTTWYSLLLIPVLALFILSSKRLLAPWTAFEHGIWLRFLILLAAFILTWVYSTYDYNLYFNQSHLPDRLLLLIMALLILWRPVFVFPFLTMILCTIWQFSALPVFPSVASLALVRIIIAFAAYLLLYVLTNSIRITDFVVLTVSMYLSHYWIPGTGKLSVWWITHNQVFLLLPNTFANGWLGFLDANVISEITQKLALFNLPLKVFIIAAECGVIFFFWRRKLALILLTGCILLQAGIFAVSGIFFWMWILMDLGLILLFVRKDAFASLPVFNLPYLIASMILFLGSSYWFHPTKLAWIDPPLNYTYRVEATTTDGKTYVLPPNFFAPYDLQFTLNNFGYLTKEPLLPIVWGATQDTSVVEWLQEYRSPLQILDYEKEHGKIYYNSVKSELFDDFVSQTILHWNDRLTKKFIMSAVQAPRQIWTYPVSPPFDPVLPIEKVTIFKVISCFQQGLYSEIQKKPIHEVSIPLVLGY